MSSSILLRPPQLPSPSPSPSPSPTYTPLPALQADVSSSSSSSVSGSYLDLDRAFSTRSTRRIRFAPLPELNNDLLLDPSSDDLQSDTKSATQPVPLNNLHDGVALSPSPSPSPLPSVCSSPTIRQLPNTPSKNTQKPYLKLLRPFAFLRRANSSAGGSPLSQPASLPGSHNSSFSSLTRSASSVPNSPSQAAKQDFLSFGRISLFRARSGSASSTRPPRPSSPPPKRSDPSKSLRRSASTGPAPPTELDNGKRDWGEGSSQSPDTAAIAGSGPRKRRASSSAFAPGAGGGRHTSSAKMLPYDLLARPSTAPSSPLAPPKNVVKMLNGRVYGAKRYSTQSLANPFDNVREEPEFVEWGYGGMGSVHASADIANDKWKGLQRSERGGALFAGSSFASSAAPTHPSVGGGRGSGAHATSRVARRKMADNVSECGMDCVGAAGGMDEDDGSGMGWVKRRRAEREAKARVEQGDDELGRKTQEKRKSGDSTDAGMFPSTASTTTSLTACTSTVSTDLTTPTTSPLVSRSSSVTDMKLPLSSSSESRDLPTVAPCTVTVPVHPAPAPKDGHGHHVLTAVRLSPNISNSSHQHEQMAPSSPVDTGEPTTSANSFGEERKGGHPDEEEEQDDVDDDDDDEHEAQDIRRKTALGAGVEKVSRHVGVEVR